MVFADNCSLDSTLSILQGIAARDPAVHVLANAANYGPELSIVNAIEQALDSDVYVLLCSDLQDPPELVIPMVLQLLQEEGCDAVLAIKSSSAGGMLVRLGRNLYYQFLGYSSRLRSVPRGFHGFGCYRRNVVIDALQYWRQCDLNIRTCLVNASQAASIQQYIQPGRSHGSSSYGKLGYPVAALGSILRADALGSRLSLLLGVCGFALALSVGIVLLANWLGGNSRYEPGTPTVMGLVLGGFALQMLMFALLSRQIESLRYASIKPRVRFRLIDVGDSDTK
jgi:glycosyltransferase involved in cell wall biosynthesis